MPVSTDRVVRIPVKLDIPAHPEMLQEHACRLDIRVGMISIVQIFKHHRSVHHAPGVRYYPMREKNVFSSGELVQSGCY